MPKKTKAFAALGANQPLSPFEISRRDPGEKDVEITILFCGICHSDIHTARNEWNMTTYPCVPGHEILGRVTKVGAKVSTFKEGDPAAVGCMVDSCRVCEGCQDNLEQHCVKVPIFTYNSPEKQGAGITYGGYSQSIVVDEAFVLKIPASLNQAAAAPLLCAGITTYSPLKRYQVNSNQKVGVVGLGGLGHMGVKIARSMGARVVVFTQSKGKQDDALRLGAHEVVLAGASGEVAKHENSFDLILDTVSADHDVDLYLNLLKRSGNMVLVGAPEHPLAFAPFSLIFQRRALTGSLIGGIKETQEMLDYCAEHQIVCDVETISIDQINEAYDRVLASDVNYRFVIDLSSLK